MFVSNAAIFPLVSIANVPGEIEFENLIILQGIHHDTRN